MFTHPNQMLLSTLYPPVPFLPILKNSIITLTKKDLLVWALLCKYCPGQSFEYFLTSSLPRPKNLNQTTGLPLTKYLTINKVSNLGGCFRLPSLTLISWVHVFPHVHYSVGDLMQPHSSWIYCPNTDSQISTSSLDSLPVLQTCALQLPWQQLFLNVKQTSKTSHTQNWTHLPQLNLLYPEPYKSQLIALPGL